MGASPVAGRCSTTCCRWRCLAFITGTIIGMARALRRNRAASDDRHAAFVADARQAISPLPPRCCPCRSSCGPMKFDRGFIERTSAAIVVLLIFLLLMNGIAIYSAQPLRETVVT